ncbi:MAG: DNA repair protein RecO [Flavobacteriales bacterium]|jgi:DNA repair protein RecO (recombination protein O)|nr:DNA repair protein RecO [Flavobacteriales bacterium]
MIESTKGIVLHYYKYSENSVIAKIFTEKFGLQSYIIKGIRNKNSKQKLSILQPLTLLQLEVSNNQKRSIQYIKEFKNFSPLTSIINSMNKRFITMFMAEVLLKVLVEKEEEKNIFNFVWVKINDLDSEKEVSNNYPIIFLLCLSKYLGFYPSKENINSTYFNLESGEFSENEEFHSINGVLKKYFSSLILNDNINIPYSARSGILKTLISYYNLHHYNLNNLKSHEIIESLRR